MGKYRISPDKYKFWSERYIQWLNSEDADTVKAAESSLKVNEQRINELNDDIGDPEWARHNLEYDLCTSDYIAEKCKSNIYAQNLYAALCNNDFRKLDLVPILREDTWHCSWRYAGGIIADIREKGDYLDWYCSGIDTYDYYDSNFSGVVLTDEQGRKKVPESTVTDEIRADLLMLEWVVLESKDEE
jgi:hypothetical protein